MAVSGFGAIFGIESSRKQLKIQCSFCPNLRPTLFVDGTFMNRCATSHSFISQPCSCCLPRLHTLSSSISTMTTDEDPFSCFGIDSETDDDDVENDDRAAAHDEHMERGRRLQMAANVRHATTSLVHLPLFPSPDYEIFHDVNRGQGVRALRPYKCGDEIMREAAAIRVSCHYAAATKAEAEDKLEKNVTAVFDSLPQATQNSVMDMCCCEQHLNKDGAATLIGVYQTNSFQLGDEHSGLFLTVARMNHSCRPNTNHFWRPDLQKTLVFASRDIEIGDEICTTYGPSESMNTEKRRKYLNERFSFECMCEMCCEGNTTGGDDRMVELCLLHEKIAFHAAGDNPEEAILAVNKCLELLKEQGIGGGVFTKPILHYGYQVASTNLRDEVLAKSYLERELVAAKNSEGAGSDRANDIQRILEGMA